MYIKARLLSGFKKPLTYHVPEHIAPQVKVGTFIHVPLRNYKTLAYVTDLVGQHKKESFEIKDIIEIAPFPADLFFETYLHALSRYYALEPVYFFKRLKGFLAQKPPKDAELGIALSHEKKAAITLTPEQKLVADFVSGAITKGTFTPTLLHGVTGSGKTEVYKTLIQKAVSEGKSVIFLVPEVTLAIQFFHLFKRQLPEETLLYSFHSATGAHEKKELWQALLDGKPAVIVGVHLPILLPVKNLGLLIVDEEHEVGYQEKKHPKINSKEAALLRAQSYNIPILLGSATPSITSLYQVKKGAWHFFELKKRFAGAFPQIKVMDLLTDKKKAIFWISSALEKEIQDRLSRREQTIIFLNRRGYSFFVVCTACSFVFNCASCSVSLTLHSDNVLRCHYCDFRTALPSCCTSCKAPEKNLLKKGIGTQQLAALIEKRFPTARVGRADLDSTINKKNWQQTLRLFENGDIDIMVGTQTITKGYHFPKVTLVGIIWADANLHFPRYNATESSLQQLIQVAGRAGRQTDKSMVVVQTFSHHPIFKFLSESDYLKFYEYEQEKRQDALYPPYTRLAEIEMKHTDEEQLDREATEFVDQLKADAANNKLDLAIVGPGTPPVSKIKNMHSRLIYIKSPSTTKVRELYQSVEKKFKHKSYIYFTPNVVS